MGTGFVPTGISFRRPHGKIKLPGSPSHFKGKNKVTRGYKTRAHPPLSI